MDLSLIFWIAWFLLTAYAIIANDSMQTLWTFMASNSKIKWQYLWVFTSTILIWTLSYSFFMYWWDISYWRLEKIPYITIQWYHLIPPVLLVVLTRFGIPVSTSLLVFSVFASWLVFEKVLLKSVLWYFVAFLTAISVWYIALKFFVNKNKKKTDLSKKSERNWRIFQWLTTWFLWFTWLSHDIANIAVFLPRDLNFTHLILILIVLISSLAYIFYKKWWKIQEIVKEKTNLDYIVTATFIDLIYAFILLFFKQYNSIPMSTTWVFLWLIAWREFALYFIYKDYRFKTLFPIIWKDLAKVFIWLTISIAIVILVTFLSK